MTFPFSIRFKFKTGMVDHPGDLLVNATVEVLTQAQKEKADALKKQGLFLWWYEFHFSVEKCSSHL